MALSLPTVAARCLILSSNRVGEQAVEAEGVPVKRLLDIGDTIGAQDVERERAYPGEKAAPAPNAAVVLTEDAVANIMVAVLDAPMPPYSARDGGSVEADLAGVIGDLLARGPMPGAGVLHPGRARNWSRTGYRAPPRRIETAWVYLEPL